MKPPLFKYARPDSVADALRILSEFGDEAKVLAGGQSLVPMMNFRLARPSVLVDLQDVDELVGITAQADRLRVGAMTRQREVERSPMVAHSCGLLPQALHWVGHLQIRNRGTIGGSIAHADPAAELPAAALALDAELEVKGPRGERRISASEFFHGPFTTSLEPDEVLVAVDFRVTAGAATSCTEVALRSGDFALVGLHVVLEVDASSQSIKRASLVAFGIGAVPVRLDAVEDVLTGSILGSATSSRAAEALMDSIDSATSDIHATGDYRRAALATLVRRATASEAV